MLWLHRGHSRSGADYMAENHSFVEKEMSGDRSAHSLLTTSSMHITTKAALAFLRRSVRFSAQRASNRLLFRIRSGANIGIPFQLTTSNGQYYLVDPYPCFMCDQTMPLFSHFFCYLHVIVCFFLVPRAQLFAPFSTSTSARISIT